MDDKAAKQKLERQKLVRYIPLIWKMPSNDRDSIKKKKKKDYHIF